MSFLMSSICWLKADVVLVDVGNVDDGDGRAARLTESRDLQPTRKPREQPPAAAEQSVVFTFSTPCIERVFHDGRRYILRDIALTRDRVGGRASKASTRAVFCRSRPSR